VSDILNPAEYANGGEKEARVTQTVAIPIYQIGAVVLIPFAEAPKCPHLIVAAFYDTFRVPVIVLDSMHASLFVGPVDIPSRMTISAAVSDPTFGVANSIGGLAAGLLIYGKFRGVECRVVEVVEDDFGPSRESFGLWLEALEGLIEIEDREGVLTEAVRLAGFRTGTFCGIYS
jgi:hypothetical protein